MSLCDEAAARMSSGSILINFKDLDGFITNLEIFEALQSQLGVKSVIAFIEGLGLLRQW